MQKTKYPVYTSPEELKHIRNVAECFASNNKTIRERDLIQEFGSYVVIEAMQGKYKKLHWLLSDFLRQEYGRLAVDGKDLKTTQFKLSLRSLDGDLSNQDKRSLGRPPALEVGQVTLSLLPKNLRPIERVSMILYYKWGFELLEIAELFQVSGSRISQILTAAVKEIKKATSSSAEAASRVGRATRGTRLKT